jgi:hypothetical protein
MFGTELAIREIRANHVIDYRRIPSVSAPKQRWSDRVRWTGHLFGAWEEIAPKLVRGLPVPFRLNGMTRIDEEAGSESLREAFVNLLVHTDYRELSDAVILHRDDGYVFTNPGDSRVRTVGTTIEFNKSERRNPALAEMFGRAGLADRAGSGFMTMFREWNELGFRAPVISSAASAYEFRLELPLSSLISPTDRAWLESIGGPWTDVEELAFRFALHEEAVTNARLRAAANKEVLETSRVLTRLRDRGYLEMHGTGKDTFYVLGPRALGNSATSEISSGANKANPGTSEVNSGTYAARPATYDPSSATYDPSSATYDPSSVTSRAATLADASQNTRAAIERIAQIFQPQRRMSRERRNRAIVSMCSIMSLSFQELERLTGRAPRIVREALREIVATGELDYLYPDRPSHPQQRYRTRTSSPEAHHEQEVGD